MAENMHPFSERVPARKPTSHFLNHEDVISEGDTVIVYVNYGTAYAVEMFRGRTLNMRYGALKHEFLIGKRYGSRVSATAGFVYALRPSADLWTRTLTRRTQILYTPDCGLILMLLDAKPGSVLCESGTGSGSLSHGLATAIAPSGHLYTHDIEETRVKQVELELNKHGLGDVTTCVHQNVCEDGFFVSNACDGVFLDLPAPWTAVLHAKKALSHARGGRIVSFSPCIEQVQRVCETLEREGFMLIETMELVPRKLKVSEVHLESMNEFADSGSSPGDEELEPLDKKRRLDSTCCQPPVSALLTHPMAQPTHTGFLTAATLLPSPSPRPPVPCDD